MREENHGIAGWGAAPTGFHNETSYPKTVVWMTPCALRWAIGKTITRPRLPIPAAVTGLCPVALFVFLAAAAGAGVVAADFVSFDDLLIGAVGTIAAHHLQLFHFLLFLPLY